MWLSGIVEKDFDGAKSLIDRIEERAVSLLRRAQRFFSFFAFGDVSSGAIEAPGTWRLPIERHVRRDGDPMQRVIRVNDADFGIQLAIAARVTRFGNRLCVRVAVVWMNHVGKCFGEIERGRFRHTKEIAHARVRLTAVFEREPRERAHLGRVQCKLETHLTLAQRFVGVPALAVRDVLGHHRVDTADLPTLVPYRHKVEIEPSLAAWQSR